MYQLFKYFIKAWLKGPSLRVCANEQSVFNTIKLASFLLQNSDLDAVIIGAYSLSGDLETVVRRQKLRELKGLKNKDHNILEGAGALVLMSAKESLKRRVYCEIESLSSKNNNSRKKLSELVESVVSNSLEMANVNPSQ